jgi:hypothetical protein
MSWKQMFGRRAIQVPILILLLFVTSDAGAVSVTDVVTDTATVGTGQAEASFLFLDQPEPAGFLEILLPAGDPFSSASATAEFTIDKPARFGLFVDVLLEVHEPGGSFPWDFVFALVRVDPDPEVIDFVNEDDPRSITPSAGTDFIDESFQVLPGRYRFSLQAAQAGGELAIGMAAILIVGPIPEPGAAVTFPLGLLTVAAVLRRKVRPASA